MASGLSLYGRIGRLIQVRSSLDSRDACLVTGVQDLLSAQGAAADVLAPELSGDLLSNHISGTKPPPQTVLAARHHG